MKNALAILLAAGLTVGGATAVYAQHDHQVAAPEGASAAYMDAMTRMNEDMEAMEMSGEPGIDFALMMIPHHQSAIDMARAYLESGEDDPELTKLSEEIVAAQESEIAFLREWLARKGR